MKILNSAFKLSPNATLAILILVLNSASSDAAESTERIAVLAPKLIRPRSDFHVLVSLADSQAPASVDVQLIGARDSDHEQSEARSVLVESGQTQTVKFQVGDWPAAKYVISVAAQAVDRSWNFSQEQNLIYKPKQFSTLVQTDKPVYKPGQLVRLRVLFLNEDLTPHQIREDINVTIRDANQNLIRSWLGLSNYRGLLSLELQLADEPVLGDWSVQVDSGAQSKRNKFRVASYVLPTFDVQLQLPSYATYNQSEVLATVKASYTFGRPVSGHVTLTVQPLVRFNQVETLPLESALYRARLSNGQAQISVKLLKDLHYERELYPRQLEFSALVEEDFTGRKYNTSDKLTVFDKHIRIQLLNPFEAFKPGLNYPLKLRVGYVDQTPVEDSGPPLELHYSFDGRNSSSAKLTPVGGLVELSLQTPNKVVSGGRLISPRSLLLKCNYRGQVHYLDSVGASSSESDQFIKIELQPQSRKADSSQQFPTANLDDNLRVKLHSTEPMSRVNCQGLSRGDIIWALSPNGKNRTELEFELRVDKKMTPETSILCFYVRPQNREVVADAATLLVNGANKNFVRIQPSREQAKPGQEVEIGVQTKPNSLVGILAVDRSTQLLGEGNEITQREVNEELKSYAMQTRNLRPLQDADQILESTQMLLMTNKPKSGSEETETAKTDPTGNDIRLSPLILDHEINPAPYNLPEEVQETLVIRSFFPETLLWENATTGGDGQVRFKARMPDSITSWSLSAFSMNEQFGLGLSSGQSSIRVFRPFFIKLNLPHSIIRGETVNVQAVIFNYSPRPMNAKVTLENREQEFEFVEAANSIEDEKFTSVKAESRLIRIPANEGKSVSFLIAPRKLGQIDIRMIAQGESAADGIVQKLLVRPEGQTQQLNKAMLISLSPEQSKFSQNFSINVPANAVAGSRRVFVSAIGDILGAELSNVDDLLGLPSGLGEQNLIHLVANVVTLKYLQNTNRLKEAQRARAVENIELAYQRQLNYRTSSGGFSTSAGQDAEPSSWLTAYTLRTLQQAKSFITVDERVLRRAASFLARHSKSDGSIEEVGNSRDNRLNSNSAVHLTAYAMIALLEKPIRRQIDDDSEPILTPKTLDEVLEKGFDFLVASLDESISAENPYDLAVTTYALHLIGRREPAEKAYEQLWARAQTSNDLTWWTDKSPFDADSAEDAERARNSQADPPLRPILVDKKHSAHLFTPNSLAVEMSSLALLTSVKRGELDRALPIVRWLISQQNSKGGFASSHDTVMAVEALAAFAEASNSSKQPVSMDIELVYPRSGAQKSEFRKNSYDQILVTNANALVHQQIRLPDNITWVNVQAQGSGLAVLQISWQYNLLVSAEEPAFYLNPILDKTSNINYLQLSVCFYYKAGQVSNNAVLDVELPSGYVADVDALPSLMRNPAVKKLDTSDGDTRVLIYLDKVTRDETCLTVTAHRVSKVSNNKPVPVQLYDYYNRQQAARIFYEPQPSSSCDICDSCSDSCSKSPKKSSRLVSLHEQRKLKPLVSRGDNYTASNGGSSTIGTDQQLLPLAPLMITIMAMMKNL